MQRLSAVIISYNEEKNIGRCIRSVQGVADEVIVVDSFSDDNTVGIANSLGAIVRQLKFEGYIRQKNKAIKLATHDMVLLLDSDEALSEELAEVVIGAKENALLNAYSMNRCSSLCGKFIKNGLWYPDRKLRLFNRNLGKCGGMDPHDRIVMDDGIHVEHLQGDLLHYAFETMQEYLEKNIEVSLIAAQSMYEAGIKRNRWKILFSPLWAFINGFFLRLGFLDGYKGFLIAFHTANQSYMKYHRLRQLHRQGFKKIIWE